MDVQHSWAKGGKYVYTLYAEVISVHIPALTHPKSAVDAQTSRPYTPLTLASGADVVH